jgi:hypothetical protein
MGLGLMLGLSRVTVESFSIVRACSVANSKPSVGESEGGRLVGAALDRIMGPGVGVKVGSDGTTSTDTLLLTRTFGPELPTNKNVITVTEATIATAAIVALVVTNMPILAVTAMATVPAAVAAGASVGMDASIAIH